MVYKLLFLWIMMLFIGIQWKMAPFESNVANQAEFVLLGAFPVVIMASFVRQMGTSKYTVPSHVLENTQKFSSQLAS